MKYNKYGETVDESMPEANQRVKRATMIITLIQKLRLSAV